MNTSFRDIKDKLQDKLQDKLHINPNIKEKIISNKSNVIFIIISIIYIILAIFVFIKDPYKVITKYYTLSIVFFLFGSFVLLMLYFFTKRKNELYGKSDPTSPSIFSFFIKLISSIFIFGLIGLILFGIIYLFKNTPLMANIILYSLNILIGIGIITFVYIFIKPFLKNQKSPMIRLIIDIITYIPCLVLSFINYLTEQYNITTKPIWILFSIEIFLIILSGILPKFLDKVINHDGILLLNKPTSLRSETTIGNFEILNKRNDKYTYNYAISSWIYLEAQSLSTNKSYAHKTTLLSYGGKPNIYYDGTTNEFIVSAKIGNDDKIVFKTKDFPYQKWVNIIINYQGGFMDIFIDNKLILSIKNIVPYMTYDNIIVGKNNGIYGFISNVNYFNKTITKDKISWIYKTTKIN
jgi:hypothetical protein